MGVDVQKFLDSKGQFIPATWESPKKPAAAHKEHRLVKRTSGIFRAGINFSNLGSVKDAIRDGERGEVGKLPFGEWETFPYFIQHNGERYVRLYPPAKTIEVVDDNGETINKRVADWAAACLSVQYFVDGVEVDRETFNGFLTPSDAKKRDKETDCITVKASNLVHLGEPDPDRPRRRAA